MADDPSRGPRSPLFGLGHLLRIRSDQLAYYEELRTRHGDAVLLRVGPYRSWLLFHPDAVEALLTRHWGSFIRFERLTRVVAQWNGPSLLLAEGEEWRERRRRVLPAFQTRRLPKYGAIAVEHAERFCRQLDVEASSSESVSFDVDAAMARLTLDIAAGTMFGSEPPANGDDIERALQILSDTAFRESTAPLVLPDWLPLGAKRRKRWAMRIMDDLVVGLVARGLERAGQDEGDLLSMLIEHHQGDPTAIRNDAMSLLIAGHETSGALLSWVFACLARYPDWLERTVQELADLGSDPAPAQLASLPVTRAIVEETLRLYPPAYALFVRRAVEDVDLSGISIRKGDLVTVAPFTLQRDPRWFPEPERFDPNRFLGDATWPRYAYLPFGAGPRVCIGQSFALMEAVLVVATILRRWRPDKAQDVQIAVSAKFSLRPRDGLRMTWRRDRDVPGDGAPNLSAPVRPVAL